MVEVGRRAVVDDPDGALPEQQIGVAGSSVDVADERVEPQGVRRCLWGQEVLVSGGIVRKAAG